jgi:hypothetical protein
MKAILLLIILAASTSCAMPTPVGNDFRTGQSRFGGRFAVASSSATEDGGGYVVGDIFAIQGGSFFTDQLELGVALESFTSDHPNLDDAQLFTGFARYYLQSEGNVRPFVLVGAGMYTADDGIGEVYRLGAGISQFISDRTSFDISVEEQFSSYVTDGNSNEKESDAVNVYLGVNVLL